LQAGDKFIQHMIDGSTQFLIPIFQRTYRWKQSHCYQLLSDIQRMACATKDENHFAGSIVLISSTGSSSSVSKWLVIDGQQRLTTLLILVSAILHRANELGLESVANWPIEAIRERFLINRHGQGEDRYKMLLTKGDKTSLCALIDGTEIQDKQGRVAENYDYFCSILDNETDVENALLGLAKLKVVEVNLHPKVDNPQAIFESLNSTGVDLSQADLIRNYVLMSQDYETQTRFYEQYWYPMERLFGQNISSRFDRFIQDFLTLETRSNALLKARDIYPTFKHWFEKTNLESSSEATLERLYELAKNYAAFALSKEDDIALESSFANVRALTDVASPVFIRLYEAFHLGSLSKREFSEAALLIESYILRRSVCGMQTRSLGNIFAALANRIDMQSPFESLKVAMARLKRNSRYPTDTEFDQALKTRELYEMRNCRHVLVRLENNSKEKMDTKNFSIEHVMPQNQNLDPEWIAMLGSEWETVQQTWLHRLGNLTLTGYNPEYSDRPFHEKKDMENGFRHSPLRLNRYIAEQQKWTEVEIEERSEILAETALNVWPALDVDEKLVAMYELKDLEAKSETVDLESILGPNIRELFSLLESRVKAINEDIRSIYSRKNLTFFTLTPFLQVIPRAGYLGLVMAVDHADLSPELSELVEDTHAWQFIPNADLSGVYASIGKESDIDQLWPVMLEAYELALS